MVDNRDDNFDFREVKDEELNNNDTKDTNDSLSGASDNSETEKKEAKKARGRSDRRPRAEKIFCLQDANVVIE